ncbi:AAA family ATPase [Streptomyces sp. NPDC002490]|uniref:AAA family ATPase n=1 Tax=Streptomyces sp. NPDC002490 TaxID=3154416 RepID=UPI0033213454
MSIRVLPAVGDLESARALTSLLGQLPDTDAALPVGDTAALLDTLGRLAAESLDELPEVVLVHERIGPAPVPQLIREIVGRYPSVGVLLVTADTSPGVLTAAMDSGVRGIVGLPLDHDALAERVQAAAGWASGMRRHLGTGDTPHGGPGGTVISVTGAKGGVGTTLTAVQLALAARSGGRSVALVDLDLQAGDVAAYLDVQFRRSIADLAAIKDINARVLHEAVFTHESGLALLLAPAEGERGEEVTDRVARQVVAALRSRYDLVVIDCGTQMSAAGAAAVELSDRALLLVTPDVIAVRAAKRMVRLWDRLQIRKAEDTTTVINRHGRGTEIQASLVARVTDTRVARTTVPAQFKELHAVVDAGRVHDLDHKSTVKQALWTLAAELDLIAADTPGPGHRRRRPGGDRGTLALRRRGPAGDRGAVTLEFAGTFPLLLAVLALLWQCALYGYTFSLAGNAADEAARAATAAAAFGAGGQDACVAAGKQHLPAAWQDADVSCSRDGLVWRADVTAPVPVLFPGVTTGWTVDAEAGAAAEDGTR